MIFQGYLIKNKLEEVVSLPYDEKTAETIGKNLQELFENLQIEVEVEVRPSNKEKGKFRASLKNPEQVQQAYQNYKAQQNYQEYIGDYQYSQTLKENAAEIQNIPDNQSTASVVTKESQSDEAQKATGLVLSDFDGTMTGREGFWTVYSKLFQSFLVSSFKFSVH